MRFPLLHCRLASLLYYLDLGQFEQEFEQVWEVVSQLEIAIVVDLLVEEQAVLVEQVEFEVGKQLAVEDTANMVEDVMNMADDIVDMDVNMVGMIEDMYDRIENIVEMVSIVALGDFGVAMAWVHSMNSEHTFDHLQEIANFDLETYIEVLALAAMVSLCPCNTRFPSLHQLPYYSSTKP